MKTQDFLRWFKGHRYPVGTSRVTRHGTPNLRFNQRIDAAVALTSSLQP